MKIAIALSALAAGLSVDMAMAFDITTHVAMTAKAMEQSRFGTTPNTSELTARLGLRDAEGIFGDRYIGFGSPLRSRAATSWEKRWMKDVRVSIPSLPTDFTMVGWIMRGAVREDDNTFETPRINETDNDPAPVFNRVFGHFFDPISNTGLSILGRAGPTAPDWAMLASAAVPDGVIGTRKNDYKISDAREAMWRALTLKQILPGGTLEQITPISGLVSFAADEAERKAYWAATFRTLGDTVHLLQDMAQPQHTRLDKHSGTACVDPSNPDAICLGGHASFFENYLKARTLQSESFSLDETRSITTPPPEGTGPERRTTRPQLNYAGYTVPAFATYRDFFATATGGANATGKGLANYSNRGFYSFGTNINGSSFPAPSPTGASLGTETITGDAFVDMTGRKLAGALKVRTGAVEDHMDRAKDVADVRLSTEGLWDQFLLQYGGGQPRYTLNYYNYDAQADLLIPRAVAYSAGLIDYFFRGQLEIFHPSDGVFAILDHSVAADNCKDNCGFKKIKLKLANATPAITVSGPSGATVPQAMTGGTLVAVAKYHKNTCYTPDLEGEYDSSKLINGLPETNAEYMARCRAPAEEINVSQPLSGQNVPACAGSTCEANALAFTFNFDAPIPINATDLYLQVVYRGALGSEPDAVVVATKDIAEPTYFSVVNVTDYLVCYNNAFYYKTATDGIPGTIPAMVDGESAASFYGQTSYPYWRLTYEPRLTLPLPAPVMEVADPVFVRVDAIQPKEYARVVVLIENGRKYNDEIFNYRPPTAPPFTLVNTALHQVDYAANGAPIANLLDYKRATFRKVKATVPLFGYRTNEQGTPGGCLGLPVPPEPTDPLYTKPTVMRAVSIKPVE